MQLLADRLVELTELQSISDETVRVALKKGGGNDRREGALAT